MKKSALVIVGVALTVALAWGAFQAAMDGAAVNDMYDFPVDRINMTSRWTGSICKTCF